MDSRAGADGALKGVQGLAEQAMREIDAGRALWYVCLDATGVYSAVCDAIRAAGRQGDLVAGRRDVPELGRVVYVRAKHAGSIAYMVRSFAAGDQPDQWFSLPVGGRHGDRAHAAAAVRIAIWRAGLTGQIGYDLSEDGMLCLYRRSAQ